MAKYEVLVNDAGIVLPPEVEQLFNTARTIDETVKELQKQKKEIEEPLKNAMLKYGVDKFQCDYMSASTVIGANYDIINTDKMKEDGIYEKYAIHAKKSDYVTIRYRKAKDE